jgi:hypothetical protein
MFGTFFLSLSPKPPRPPSCAEAEIAVISISSGNAAAIRRDRYCTSFLLQLIQNIGGLLANPASEKTQYYSYTQKKASLFDSPYLKMSMR